MSLSPEAAKLLEQVRSEPSLPSPAQARRVRVRAGLSQQQMADGVPVHRITLGRWEAGLRVPSGEQRAHYAELLHALRNVRRNPQPSTEIQTAGATRGSDLDE